MTNFFKNLFVKSKKDKSFYITATLPYVNSVPHVGYAMEIVRTDVVARYKRLMGYDVFFNTGTDEHGIKVYQKAQEEGKDTKEFVDELSGAFRGLKETLNLSTDRFIRTTDSDHKLAAQEFWKKCDENGYIYKKEYSGLYCVGCELFITEKDLVDGECPHHPGRKPEMISEENYFFKYSEFAKPLLDLYEKNPEFVIPSFRLNEIRSFVDSGLEDFSISRLKEKMPWGVPVPGDEDHVMYVWFDALVSYISTLGWPNDTDKFNQYWVNGTPTQYCGKDNLQFQAARWQAMLMSVGLPISDKIIINGFIVADGQKMSKSLGNVVDPIEVVEKYGIDALRYYLVRELSPFEDSDFTMEKFEETYNANLANGIGNVVSRTLKMAETNGVKIDGKTLDNIEKKVWGNKSSFHKHFDEYNLQKASDEVWGIIGDIDAKITETEPFKLVKTDPEKAKAIIFDLVKDVYKVAVMLEPFMPKTSQKVKEAVKLGKKPESLFVRI